MYLTQSDRPTPKKIESNQSELPKPSQIKYFLDQYVQGQENAKIALATAVYCHFLCVACRNAPALWESDNDSNILLSPHHVLLIGASGSGKSYLVQLLSEFLGVPYSFVSATTLVQTGYVGTTIEKMIQSRYADCGEDLQLAQTGILFIDEIDKTRANSSASGPDVSGEGVQHALLTLLDGKPISIAENGNTDSPKITFDPSGLLIICAGAFGDLPEIVRQRIGSKRSLGFEATETTQKPQALTDAEALELIQTEDLVSFGLIREFIGRFSAIAPLAALTTDDLLQILVKSKSSIVQQQKQLFQLHGIDLIFTDEALRAIANKAIELNTGARGLTRIVKVTLQDISFRLPDLAESGISGVKPRYG